MLRSQVISVKGGGDMPNLQLTALAMHAQDKYRDSVLRLLSLQSAEWRQQQQQQQPQRVARGENKLVP